MYGIEKEMIEDYGVESSVWIGGKRIVLGINEENTEKPRYMSCIVTDNGLFGRYEGITTDDYFEALKHFGENIGAESIILRNEQKIDGLKDTACLTPKDMIPIDWHYSIKECTVAVKPEVLSEGCRNIGNQLYYIVGGFGAEANSRGSACYGWNLCRRKYYGRMLQICHQILRHPQDSEDAAMNAMKRIAENSKKFSGKDRNEIISLVVIYTRNAALTYYNQRKRRYTISTTMESPELSETSQMDIPDESQDIQRIVINCETIHMIEDALDQLVDEQKDVILLKYYYGYRIAEMSEVLGVEENVVRARIFRAKKRLKKLLGDDAYERMYF